jgi:hypothetical protein
MIRFALVALSFMALLAEEYRGRSGQQRSAGCSAAHPTNHPPYRSMFR